MIELINPYVTRILITAKDNDSVRSISKRIGLSYAWTYNWMQKLVDLNVIKRKGQKIHVNKESIIYKQYLNFIKNFLKETLSLSDAYSLPNLTGLDYAFTSTDSIFIWTKGGYNIGRSKDSYPIFIEVLDKDLSLWSKFFDSFSIQYSDKFKMKKGIYFISMPKKEIEKEYMNGVYVIPLKSTVDYAKKYVYNFQPALEMLNQMYDLNMDIKYAEKEM